MSFSSNYLKELEKRKKEQEESGKKNTGMLYSSHDIAPVRHTNITMTPSKSEDEEEVAPVKEEKENKWFQSGAFEDGYQFGDVFKTIVATDKDLTTNIAAGILGIGEKVVDAGATAVGWIGSKFGADEFAEKTKNFVAKDLYDEEKLAEKVFGSPIEKALGLFGVDLTPDYEERSVLGEKTDALAQSGGQLVGTIALQSVGVPWWATSGATSFGSEAESAFNEGATYDEAVISGFVTAGAELLSEKLFGGSGLGEKGLIKLDVLTKGISNKAIKLLADFGLDMAAEGSEEVVSEFLSTVGTQLTYEREETLTELLNDEEAMDAYLSQVGNALFGEEARENYKDAFIGGTVLGGFANVGKVKTSVETGRDYRTELTESEQSVVDREFNDRLSEKENGGEKLSKKEKAELYDKVIRDMERGYLDTGKIESVVGGETFKQYETAKAREDAILKEYEDLGNKKDATLSEKARYEELGRVVRDIKAQPQSSFLKSQMRDSILSRGDRLAESYREQGRRGESFKVNIANYDEKEKETVQKAIDSGILNNTNRTHEFVDMLAKLTADKGVSFDFTDNAKLKESGFAIDGATVNGYVTKDGVTVNIDSQKALNTVVGHEITHVLEGTELYTELQKAIFDYARTKNDFGGRYDSLKKLYKDVEGANVDAELTADLVGDYLFTDEGFISNLSANHRNIFQKIYDEIKYLLKVAVAGSKEARELEKVKRAFDKAYKESGKAVEGTKYSMGDSSLSDSDGKTLSKEQSEYFKDSKMRDDNGALKVMYHGSQDAGFHIFDGSMSDDGTSFFFVDRNDVAATYSGTTETYEAQSIRTAEDMNKFIESIGAEGYEVIEEGGVFTLEHEGDYVASSNTAKGIYEEFCWYEGVGEGDANYKVYLNLTNPLVVDAEGRNWNNISREYSQEIADRYNSLTAEEKKALTQLASWEEISVFRDEINDAVASVENGKIGALNDPYIKNLASAHYKLEGANIYDMFSIASENFSAESIKQFAVKQMNTRDYAAKAKAEGYDGVIFKNIHDNGGYSAGSEGASTVAIAFSSDQIKSVANAKPTSDPDIRYSLSKDSEGRELSPAVKNRFGNSKVVDENGDLKVVYHGTPAGEFSIFDKSKGSVEGDFGSGFYFTDNEYDVTNNYEGGGPDFDNKVSRRAEQIYNEALDEDNEITYEEAERRAREELYKGAHKFEVYLNIENPAIVGETILFEPDSYWSEYNQEDFVSEDEYYEAVEQLINDDIDGILWDIQNKVDIYKTDGISDVLWEAFNEGGVDLEKLKKRLSKLYLEDSNGNLVENEVARQIVESLGYDGIIDPTVSNKWNMDMESGTTHYIVFKPNQIKAVTNENPTDNPDIHRSLTKEGDTPKKYGNYNVSGEDVRLEAPVREDVAESETASSEIEAPEVTPEPEADTRNWRDIADSLTEPELDADGSFTDEYLSYHNHIRHVVLNAAVNEVINDVESGMSSTELAEKSKAALKEYEQVQANKPGDRSYTEAEQIKLTTLYNQYSMYESVSRDPDFVNELKSHVEYAPVSEAITEEEASALASESLASLEDSDAPPETEAPYYEEEKKVIDPFEDRDYENVGNRKVKAYMYENPEVKPFFQEEANRLLGEYESTERAETLYNGWLKQELSYEFAQDIPEVYRVPRNTTPSIEYLRDTVGLSYADIEKGLKAIIEDNGAENIAAAKKIEFHINDRLLYGYQVMGENIPPNQEYINFLRDKQISEYNREVLESAEEDRRALMDEIAPVIEKTPEKAYEAIRPPKESKEPRMKRIKEGDIAPTYETEKNGQRQRSMFPQDKVAEVYDQEPEATKKKSRAWSKFRTNFLDKFSVFEDLSLKTHNRELMGKANHMLSSESRAQWMIGKGVDGVKSLNSIREEVEGTGKTKQFYEYLYHKHNVDRMRLEDRYEDAKNKPVFGFDVTAEVSEAAAKQYETENPEFKQFAEDVYTYMNHLRGLMVESGVISQETADLWAEMYPHYVPIRRLGDSGLNVDVPLYTGRTGVNAPVKKATGGNRDILPLFDTMAMRTEQTFKAIAKNNFGVELKNTLGTTVESTDTNLDEVLDDIDKHEELLKEGKDGKNPTFTVFEDGKKVTFEITEDMYDALKPTSDGLRYTNKVANAIGRAHRGILTEYNPVFMATNAIKDAQDILINSQHPAKTYANLPKAFKELASKGKWYSEYMKNGGEQNTYFDGHSNTFKKEDSSIKKIVGMPLRAISAANNFVERAPRLAEYIASREAGASVEVAMLDAARVTTNFQAGGDVTKFFNRNGFNFLNASTQGAMQQVRNVREAKANGFKGYVQLATKFAIAGLPALLLNHLLWEDDEDYEELSDYVKDNYYVVAKYGDGQFVRIPKGRTLAVIQNALEQTVNALTGDDEVDLARFLELAITNIAPNNPLDNNIIAPIMQAVNNETWYGEDLVPTRLQDLPAAEQYDESTDALSKWLGEKLNISPYKLNYVLNQYSGGIGDVFLPMMTPEAERGDNSIFGNMIAPLKDKFTTDSVMNNQNVSDFYTTMDELTANAKSSKATDEDVLKYKYFNTINSELGELYAQKREIQNGDLPDDEKYAAVRDIQREIDALARESLDTYGEVNIDGDYAYVGDQHFRVNKDGEWQKITDDQLEKQEEVTSGLGISASDYWSDKEEYDFAYEYPEKYEFLNNNGISYDDYANGSEEYKEAYSWAFKNPEKFELSKAVASDVVEYRRYAGELYDIKADKDEDGKSITGSRKEKVLDYINGLDLDYGARLILFKNEYNADDTYNYEIINYLNEREDISYEQMETILKELGFKVDSEGNISWD